MKIAIFGTKEIINRIDSVNIEPNQVDILPLTYDNPRETPQLIERAFNCDTYLFTEPLSYLAGEDIINKSRLPVVQVPYDAFMVATTFYNLLKDTVKPLENIGIDVVDREQMMIILNELGYQQENIQIFTHQDSSENSILSIIESYERLWQEEKIEHVFTISEEIYQALQTKQIPVRLFDVPTINLKQALDEARSLFELKHASNTQLVTGIITLKEKTLISEETLETIRSILRRFTEQTRSSFIEDNKQRFIITGTDKLLEHLRGKYREFPLLQSLINQIDQPVYLGFGLGLHATEASEHAELAVNYCSKSPYSICYIVNERQKTIGPIGIKKEIDTSKLYQALIHRAKLNNELSYNFINFIKERNNESFSSNDVALFYNVTKRSAERTVNKLLAGDIIRVSGEERPYVKGRPRKLFSLKQ